MSYDSSNDSSDHHELLERWQSIQKRVKNLKAMKKDLQEKLHSPIAFKHVVQKLPPGRPDKINLDYEVDMVMQNLFIHKLVGVVSVSQTNNQIVLEMNACVQGDLYEPFVLRISKEQGGSFKVLCYTMPCSVRPREMIQKNPLVNGEELVKFLRTVQCCVECYYSRKLQITKAKEMWEKFFYSSDYMFVEISFFTHTDSRKLSVTLSLIYESDKDIPSSSEIFCKEADPEMRKQLKNEFDQELRYFTQLPLDEAVALFKESVDDQLLSSAGTVVIQRQEKDFEEGGDEVMEVDAST